MLAGLQQVTFEFGARLIVADATWHIQPGERIGLIGYNGTGKSTLLKLFVGDFQPSAGSVERSRETSIGYLHQDLLSFNTADSILKVALQAFSSIPVPRRANTFRSASADRSYSVASKSSTSRRSARRIGLPSTGLIGACLMPSILNTTSSTG